MKRALAKAKVSAKYERPLLSEILDCFGEEQDSLIKLAHEHNKDTKKSKRDDEHLAALGRLGKQAASASPASGQASYYAPPARPYRQTGDLAGQVCK